MGDTVWWCARIRQVVEIDQGGGPAQVGAAFGWCADVACPAEPLGAVGHVGQAAAALIVDGDAAPVVDDMANWSAALISIISCDALECRTVLLTASVMTASAWSANSVPMTVIGPTMRSVVVIPRSSVSSPIRCWSAAENRLPVCSGAAARRWWCGSLEWWRAGH